MALVLGVAVCAAGLYSALLVALLAAVAGFSQALAKLSLDALIQDRLPDRVRASAFARSETLLQLSWVLGGGLGTVLPLPGAPGLAVAAVGLAVVLFVVLRAYLSRQRRTDAR